MSTDACIKVERDAAIARLELHQPARRNAMRYSMWCELDDVVQTLASDDAVRVVVMTGAGEQAFCAGADISEFDTLRATAQQTEHYDAASHRAIAALESFPKPIIGRIRGFCVGGGFELALLCDIRVCSDEARFAVTPARLGLGYSLDDTRLLVGALGAPAVREILFTGRLFDAAEALRLGIVNQVVPAHALDDAVADYAREIAGNAPLTVRASKAIIREAARARADANEALCRELVADCYASEDYAEGRRAFAEKRKPRFTGR